MTLLDLLHDAPCAPNARATDPPTAHEAGAAATTRAPRTRALVLAALRAAGDAGLTDYELSVATGLLRTSCGKRRVELVRAGLVEDSGERRLTDTSTTAIVWRVVGA